MGDHIFLRKIVKIVDFATDFIITDTALTRALIKEGRALIKSLNTSTRNLFRRNPEVLAEWRTASRIHHTGGSGVEETAAAPAIVTP